MAKTRDVFVRNAAHDQHDEAVAGAPSPAAAAPSKNVLSKEDEANRAIATERAALSYLAQRRSGNAKASVRDCCDAAALETGYPRPAETSVRRLLPKFTTDEEKAEKRAREERSDLRAAATRAAAELYRRENGDGDGEVIMSVTRCCAAAEEERGIRPAETSVRRMLARMYEEEGIEPKKKKARPTPKGGSIKGGLVDGAGGEDAPNSSSPRDFLMDSDVPPRDFLMDSDPQDAARGQPHHQPSQRTALPTADYTAAEDIPQNADHPQPEMPYQRFVLPAVEPLPADMPPLPLPVLPEPEVDVVPI